MLQPALNTPTLTPSALSPPGAAVVPSAPTYGSLMDAAREALDRAIVMSNGRAPSSDVVLQELLGYERFLHNAGRHLHQLVTLADLPTDALRRLHKRLARSTLPEPGGGHWLSGATLISAAHDLVATHLIEGVPRTIEAEDLLVGAPAAGASRALNTMILEAVDGSRQLMHRVSRAQQRRSGPRIPGRVFSHIHATNDLVSLCARAMMWDLARATPITIEPLARLPIALPTSAANSRVDLRSPLAGLRVLRQVCHDQARGLTPASPASLRDLALLGVRVNDPDALQPTDDQPPLTRLQRAHTADQLDHARTSWQTASTELTTTVQGLTKAPGSYGAAIHALLNEPLDDRTRTALIHALPTLGREAARTIDALAERGDLVTRQPIPLQPRTAWRPITPAHGTEIAERFRTAARTATNTSAAVRELRRGNTPGRSQTSRRAPRQRLESRSPESPGLSR